MPGQKILWWISQTLGARTLAAPFGILFHVFSACFVFRSICGCAFVPNLNMFFLLQQVRIFSTCFIFDHWNILFICLLLRGSKNFWKLNSCLYSWMVPPLNGQLILARCIHHTNCTLLLFFLLPIVVSTKKVKALLCICASLVQRSITCHQACKMFDVGCNHYTKYPVVNLFISTCNVKRIMYFTCPSSSN